MTDRSLRAKILLEEAAALGVELADLVAADAATVRMPTVAEYVSTIAGSFGQATAATYWPYWRLAITLLGDRRLAEVTVVDLQLVVAEAASRARRRRSTSNGRSSQETCVAALRAMFSRARAAGLIRADPAGLLVKPRRAGSRRRALDDIELAELIDAVRATSNDPDLDLLLVRFHLESGAAARAPSTSGSGTSTPVGHRMAARERRHRTGATGVTQPGLVARRSCHQSPR